MTSSGDSNAPRRRDSGDLTAVRTEALDVLSDVLVWQLAEPRWQPIERILIAMDAALAQGDMDALEEATADLELAGPVRLIPIGPAVGPTPVARDLLNKLVHSLGGVTAPGQAGEPEDAGAGHADTPGS